MKERTFKYKLGKIYTFLLAIATITGLLVILKTDDPLLAAIVSSSVFLMLTLIYSTAAAIFGWRPLNIVATIAEMIGFLIDR